MKVNFLITKYMVIYKQNKRTERMITNELKL